MGRFSKPWSLTSWRVEAKNIRYKIFMMKQDMIYRTALKKKGGVLSRQRLTPDVEVIEHAEFELGTVFKHDLSAGVPDIYQNVDVIYSELPYRGGYAGSREYRDFITVASSLHNILHKPVLIAGPLLIEKIGDPHRILHDYEIASSVVNLYAWGWNGAMPGTWKHMLPILIKAFDSVGDPACGFGNTGLAFALSKKRFIMSDVNVEAVSVTIKRLKIALGV